MTSPTIQSYIRRDAYAKFIGAEIEAIEPGYSRVSVTVTEEMLNFHGATHGGIVFELGDIAFAAACNSHGQTAVALNVNVSFIRATQAGARLVAEAREINLSSSTALYDVVVTEANSGQLVAKMQATAYRKREKFA